MPYRLADACYECGLMLIKKGDRESAGKYLERALRIFTDINSTKMMERASKAMETLK
jgi:Tfp pilus assembly protein PilF